MKQVIATKKSFSDLRKPSCQDDFPPQREPSFLSSLLIHLDKKCSLQALAQNATASVMAQDPSGPRLPIVITFPIDLPRLMYHDVKCGVFVMQNPSEAMKVLKEIAQAMLQECGPPLPRCLVLARMHVEGLPFIIENTIYHKETIGALDNQVQGLFHYRGLICAMSLQHFYVKSTTFLCENSQCKSCDDVCIDAEQDLQRFCLRCCREMKEDIKQRAFGERRIVFMLPNIHGDECFFEKSLSFIVQDEDLQGLRLGKELSFVAQRLRKGALVYQLWPDQEPQHDCQFQSAASDDRDPNWETTVSAVDAFAPEVFAHPALFHVKLVLLLHLLHINNQPERTMHLVFCGVDLALLNRVIKWVSGLHHHVTFYRQTQPFNGKMNHEAAGPENCIIEGGVLSIAGRGCCIFSDLSSMKIAQQKSFYEALASRKLELTIPPALQSAYGQVLKDEIRCSVIACCEEKHLKNWSNAFDLTVVLDDFSEQDDFAYSESVLLEALAAETPSYSYDDFLQIIEESSRVSVEVSTHVASLIKQYFVGWRRCTDFSHDVISPHAINTITNLACSHALLNRRNETHEDDAVLAILLHEMSALKLSGFSPLGIGHSFFNVMPAQLKEQLEAFRAQLHRFLIFNMNDSTILMEE